LKSAPEDMLRRRGEIEGLIAAHIPSLRRYLYVLHRGNAEEAEDSLQDGLLRAVQRFDSFRGPGGFKTWLFAVCRNAALDRMRRHRRRGEAIPDEAGFFEDIPSPHPGPAETVENNEKRSAVVDALMSLPLRLRMPLVMKELEGLSVAETAHVLDIPEGTVKSRLSAGRKRLARQFNRRYNGGFTGGSDE
jgi:RNA polymerase sigma-70 factor (ECF subfamily)